MQGKWVSENLGPSMRKSPITKNVKILAGDDQRYTFPLYFDRMYKGGPNVSESSIFFFKLN
jgi:glucosylceramidase